MNSENINQNIDLLLDKIFKRTSNELSQYLESITLVGSYAFGKISLERPNVNILFFTKPNIPSFVYLKISEILYQESNKFNEYFGIKIDSLPFIYGIPTGQSKTQLVLSPNFLSMEEKDNKPMFGIAHNVLQGMKASRKVVFGTDPLADIEPTYTHHDVLEWAILDVGILFKNILIRTPLACDIDSNLDWLAHNSLELGKSAINWGTEIYLNDEDIKKSKNIELLQNKEELPEFFSSFDKELGASVATILDARTHFEEYKTDKEKAMKLYDAAYVTINKVFQKVIKDLQG